MNPKDRATKLVNTFYIKLHESKGYYDIENAKNCALICADEFLESKGLKGIGNLLVRQNSDYSENGTQKLMIEFAKMHVSEALKSAGEKFDVECNKQAVLCSYKLDDIN